MLLNILKFFEEAIFYGFEFWLALTGKENVDEMSLDLESRFSRWVAIRIRKSSDSDLSPDARN